MKHYHPPKRTEREEASMGPRMMKDPHSVEYAWQTVNWLKGRYHSLTISEDHWKKALAEAEQYQIYTRVPPEKPYGSMDAMLKAEIGEDVETSFARLKARATKQGERNDLVDSAKLQTLRAKQNGVSRFTQKNLDWLARLRPDLLKRVQAGELSVNRACIEAGHIKQKTPLDLLEAAWNKASVEEQATFLTRHLPKKNTQRNPTHEDTHHAL